MLDVQIVAASVEQLRAGLNMTNDEISWVQTSYLTAEIIAIPLAAHWIGRWGAERVYAVSCLGFVAASAMTAAAIDLTTLIAGRAIQGFVGGAMLPTVFAFAFSALPTRDRPRNSLLLSLAATLAPTLGPAFGGFLTDLAGWRWLFLINIAPGLVSAGLVFALGRSKQTEKRSHTRLDRVGFILLSILLVGCEYIIEEGPSERWLDSEHIILTIFICMLIFIALIYHLPRARSPIIDFTALKDRNFALGIIMVFMSGIALLGGTFLLPLFLADVLRYTPTQIGLTVFVSGAAMLITGLMIGRHLHKVDPRLPIVGGFAIAAIGFSTGCQVTAEWSGNDFLVLQLCRGIGVMIAVTVAQTCMMSTLNPALVPGASSLVFLARNAGGAVGLASVSSLLEQWWASHFAALSTQLGQAGPAAAAAVTLLQRKLEARGQDNSPNIAAARIYNELVQQEALIMAYQECFAVLTVSAAIAAVAALIMRVQRATQ